VLLLGDSSPYNSTNKTNKNKYTKTKHYNNTVQTVRNTLNTSTHITKIPTQLPKNPTYTHPHITKQVKTTTVQDTHQMRVTIPPSTLSTRSP